MKNESGLRIKGKNIIIDSYSHSSIFETNHELIIKKQWDIEVRHT